MRKVTQYTTGSPDVLELVTDAPRPLPAPGEVLIEVKAAGVNPVDAKVRAGSGLLGEPPFTLGWDVSGVVVEGDGFEPGDEVFGLVRFPREAACYAEYVTAPFEELLLKPPTITHDEAAAIPLVAETAWQALVHAANVQPGERVLIHAGAGGVGHVAIQIAKARGAHVITTASEIKHDFVKALGADEVIDYRENDFAAELAGSLDVVLDTVGAGTAAESLPTLKPGGRLVTIVEYRDESLPGLAEEHGVEYHGMLVKPSADDLFEIVKLIADHKFKIELAAVLSMEQADKAHELIETHRTTGKIVLIP
ncbi:MAG: NADP-dependent oxidoreductase [Thermoleophilaceae bacterium]|nr:NADP-dependent oxidoreductase [Thermoleophilaceae bacterium]